MKNFRSWSLVTMAGCILLLMLTFLPNQMMAQSCSCGGSGSTYSGYNSTYSVSLGGTYSCLAINGIFDIYSNVTLTSSDISLGESAQIRVHSGATLTLNNCTISGCGGMWERILINSGAKLVASNCTIEDGVDGFDARGDSELDIQSCLFTNNTTGIYLRGSIY